uniref:Uncharacterized protein n=1 Tax=Pristionchus pacificus TaxID=54126 RepID=A0A8R1YY49_PRIPA
MVFIRTITPAYSNYPLLFEPSTDLTLYATRYHTVCLTSLTQVLLLNTIERGNVVSHESEGAVAHYKFTNNRPSFSYVSSLYLFCI